jgi:hypothetical protein
LGDRVSAIARSLSDCDFCSCSSADSGVGGADFRFGAMMRIVEEQVREMRDVEGCLFW